MGHNIPTFFFPVHAKDLEDTELSTESVQNLLGTKYESRYEEGIREVSSRNWWYQETVLEIAKHLDLSGLDFLSKDIVVLKRSELSNAIVSLEKLLADISSGVPFPVDPQQDEYVGIVELRDTDCSLAFEKSSPKFEVNPPVDSGFEAVVGFYSFLKSLRVSIKSAIENGQYLIYYRPQP